MEGIRGLCPKNSRRESVNGFRGCCHELLKRADTRFYTDDVRLMDHQVQNCTST